MRLFKILNFCLIISFLNKRSTDKFFQYYLNFGGGSKILRYIRFWRYIQTILRFTKNEGHVRKQALPFVAARYVRTSEAFFVH